MSRCLYLARRRGVLAGAVFAVAALALVWPRSGTADLNGAVFSSTQWGQRIELTAPKNWRPSEERSYPNVLLWMARRDPPGRILLTAEPVSARTTSLTYARQTAVILNAIGFEVRRPRLHSRTGAYWMDFHSDDRYLRQAFLVVGSVGYALTPSAPDRRTRGAHLRAFDYALRTITVRRAADVEDSVEAEDGEDGDDGESGPGKTDTGDADDTADKPTSDFESELKSRLEAEAEAEADSEANSDSEPEPEPGSEPEADSATDSDPETDAE